MERHGDAAGGPDPAVVPADAGLPPTVGRWLARRYADAGSALAADPWRVLACPGVDPVDADALARRLDPAVRPDDARRTVALAGYALARAARDGHTVRPAGVVRASLAGLGVRDVPAALAAARDTGVLVDLGTAGLAAAAPAREEDELAAGLTRLSTTAVPLTTADGVAVVCRDLDDEQASAVAAAATAGVSVLLAGPGTGAGRATAAVAALAAVRSRRCLLVASHPAAARRLAGRTGQPVATVPPAPEDEPAGVTGGYPVGPDPDLAAGPPAADVVVVHGADRLDVAAAARLVAGCPEGTHLVLVGDPDALPPAGPGQPLADVVACGRFPVARLGTVHREGPGAAIARLVQSVREGVLPGVDRADREVVVLPAGDDEAVARRVVQLVATSIPRAFGIPAARVQVLTPVCRGPAGALALNAAIKAAVNPGPGALAGLDPGDRVVVAADRPDAGVVAGDAGELLAADGHGGAALRLPAGEVAVPAAVLDDLSPGWAVTVDRAAGQAYPAVVAVLPAAATGLLSRPLVYTALSRACTHLSVVHAAGPALVRAVQEVPARPRRTRLAALLRAALPESPPAG